MPIRVRHTPRAPPAIREMKRKTRAKGPTVESHAVILLTSRPVASFFDALLHRIIETQPSDPKFDGQSVRQTQRTRIRHLHVTVAAIEAKCLEDLAGNKGNSANRNTVSPADAVLRVFAPPQAHKARRRRAASVCLAMEIISQANQSSDDDNPPSGNRTDCFMVLDEFARNATRSPPGQISTQHRTCRRSLCGDFGRDGARARQYHAKVRGADANSCVLEKFRR